jgi:hypothetical protein
LATKKFKQFEGNDIIQSFQLPCGYWIFFFFLLTIILLLGLCHENLKPSEDGPQTLAGDLQGFWDMMMLQVDNIDASFDDLRQCRENGWQVITNIIINKIIYLILYYSRFSYFRNHNHQVHKHQKVHVFQSDHLPSHKLQKARITFLSRSHRQHHQIQMLLRSVKNNAKS